MSDREDLSEFGVLREVVVRAAQLGDLLRHVRTLLGQCCTLSPLAAPDGHWQLRRP